MATISKGYTFGATELVTNTKLHTLVDSATITDSNYVSWQNDMVFYEGDAVIY